MPIAHKTELGCCDGLVSGNRKRWMMCWLDHESIRVVMSDMTKHVLNTPGRAREPWLQIDIALDGRVAVMSTLSELNELQGRG